MKTLLLLALPLLLLASTARADDEGEALEAALGDVAAEMGRLELEAEDAEDPQRKQELLRAMEGARRRMNEIQAQLLALHDRRTMEDYDRAMLHAKGEDLLKQVWEDTEQLETQLIALLAQEEKRGDDPAGPEEVQSLSARMQELYEAIARMQSVRAQVDVARATVEQRRYDEARRQMQEALRSYAEHRKWIDEQALQRTAGRRIATPPKGHVPHRVEGPTPEAGQQRIEHLQAAAHHLREAGLVEQAEHLEGEIRRLEEAREARVHAASAPGVLGAVEDLRREVQALRAEVRELKEILLEERRAR